MADFKVGDEVFAKHKITCIECDTLNGVSCISYGTETGYFLEEGQIIPASRVTVAKARRKARMPEDFDKQVWVSDDGQKWSQVYLSGYCRDAREGCEWIDECGDGWQFCEVEE